MYISSQEQGSVLRAQARPKNLECSPRDILSQELVLEVPSSGHFSGTSSLTWIFSKVASTVGNMSYPSPFCMKVNGSQVAIVCVVIITRK